MAKVLEIDANQNIVIEREMTESEMQDLINRQRKAAENVQNAQNVLAARASALAKLEALGLTGAEIAALVG